VKTYIMHKKTGAVGITDIPEWVDFDEQPARMFNVQWDDMHHIMMATSTNYSIRIDKEVYDILRSVEND